MCTAMTKYMNNMENRIQKNGKGEEKNGKENVKEKNDSNL